MHKYALKRGYPIIILGEGGGLRMPDGMGSDGISENMMDPIILPHCRQVPFFTGIMGDSYGETSWCAASSDFTVQVKGVICPVHGYQIKINIRAEPSVQQKFLLAAMLSFIQGGKVEETEIHGFFELVHIVTGKNDE